MGRANTRLLLSLATMVAVLAVGELWFRSSTVGRALTAADDFAVMAARVAEAEPSPEVIGIGDSRVRHSFDTGTVERIVRQRVDRKIVAWNLGRGAVIGESQLALALRSLDGDLPPRLALVFVDPTGFVKQRRPSLQQKVSTKGWRLADLPSLLRAGPPLEELLTIVVTASLSTMRYRDELLEVALRGGEIGAPAKIERNGYGARKPVRAKVRRGRAIKRGKSYRKRYDGAKSGFELSRYSLDALRETLRVYQRAGTGVVLISSASASEVRRRARGPATIVPRYFEEMRRIAAAADVSFVDHSSPPVIGDEDYVDGDHMNRIGAARYTTWLTHEVVLPSAYGISAPLERWDSPRPTKGCEVVFDFEEHRLTGWRRRGPATAKLLASTSRGRQDPQVGFEGLGLLSTYQAKGGTAPKGRAESPTFEISRPVLKLLVGGGKRGVGVEVLVDGQIVGRAQGSGGRKLVPRRIDLADHVGAKASLRVVDGSSGELGYLTLDQVQLCD